MPELWPVGPTPRGGSATVRVARLASRQWGVVSRRQLRGCGLSGSTVDRWVEAGRLHRVHPAIYAVGHERLSAEGHLAAALLYAGPGAALSAGTAAWWWGLWPDPPGVVHVVVPGRRAGVRGVRIHRTRSIERTQHRGLPVTTVERTLLDVAAVVPPAKLRRTLAEADYRRLLDLPAVEGLLGRGRPGAAALRNALAAHTPRFARTRSELEQRFLLLCAKSGVPLPEVNVTVEGFLVDALWRHRNLVAELDGHAAHATPARVERDRRRDLALRAAGFVVLRYTWLQVTREAESVGEDLAAALSASS